MESVIANGAQDGTMHDHGRVMITKPTVSGQLPLWPHVYTMRTELRRTPVAPTSAPLRRGLLFQ
jgi:hypothetical protein